MVDKQSINFLPNTFKTHTNRKLLNATMDQLISEPNMQTVYGYIGEQDLSPAYQSSDAYVQEADSYSQFYQLEPGLVINKRIANTENFKVQNAFSYIDFLNGISAAGGITNNHSRLFANEYYNYEGFVDLDKLVNYSRYYWMPNGPKTLEVSGGGIPLQQSYIVSRPGEPTSISAELVNRNVGITGYSFEYYENKINPVITLVRGGSYTFKVGQNGHPFWIQQQPGLNAGLAYQDNILNRQIFGVANNGAEVGTITFNVPAVGAQDQYSDAQMRVVGSVDFVSDLAFNQIHNSIYDRFMQDNNIDGVKSFDTATIILTNEQNDYWYAPENYDDPFNPYDYSPYSFGNVIPEAQRRGIWQIKNVDGLIKLSFLRDWPVNTKLFVNSGYKYGHLYIFKDQLENVYPVPALTADLNTLYYQDGVDVSLIGEIRLVEQDTIAGINVTDILGSMNYTSPNGVTFTNGLKIKFSGTVTPAEYSNNEYVVEGVGTGIKLVLWSNLVTPDPNNPNLSNGYSSPFENFDMEAFSETLNAPIRKDYVVINRSAVDGNPWSRTNRWVHEDVISYALRFGNERAPIVLDNSYRATRPIIEFDPNLQLWNYGNKFAGIVTAVDVKVTDKSNEVDGRSPYVLIDSNGNYYTDGIALEDNTWVIFTKEKYENTANKIYSVKNIKPHSEAALIKSTYAFAQIGSRTLQFTTVNDLYVNMGVVGTGIFAGDNSQAAPNTVIMSIDHDNKTVTLNNPLVDDIPLGTAIQFNNDEPQVHLIPIHTMAEGETVVAVSGVARQNTVWQWHNDAWKESQEKTSLNQAPLFDVYNLDGISWGNADYYPSTTFAGSRLFGYSEGTGTADTELGFPLTYRTVGNIGDIVFENYYDTDDFYFNYNNKDQTLAVNLGYVHENIGDVYKLRNNWNTVAELSKQYIQKRFVATETKFNGFSMNVRYINSINEKNLFVYVNGKEVTSDKFTVIGSTSYTQIDFDTDLISGDVLVVNIYGTTDSLKENYTIPKNLVDNSINENFDTLTLGQIRNHLFEISKNSLHFKNTGGGKNNLRDINYKIIPGKILQHSAGAHIAQTMFNNDSTNIVKAIEFNRRSYSRFKDRLLYMVSSSEFGDISNPRECLDIVLNEISINSSSDQSFYYTDMIPHGLNNFIVNEYPVYDTNYVNFNLIAPYDITEPSYHAVLVYKNNGQLLLGKDYTVDGYIVSIISPVNIADVITIYEYSNTRGCMIPATPTKLGMYPKFVPSIYNDDTYVGAERKVIQGHDGSVILAFNDYRDDILLEFEKRIYNNLNVEFNNDPRTSYTSVEPGAFRNTEYSIDEWTQLLSSSYLSWAGTNNINIFANSTESNDLFSYNYSQGKDRLFQESLPGYWRGIFKYFYDTDQPHARPWEMLGFSAQPEWWEVRYGPAPYTAGNTVLWDDLEAGLVYMQGSNSYVDSRYARPGLSEIIPVDANGNLLPPVSCIVSGWNANTSGSTWRFGDQSPQETVWRRSSDYPFAVQIAWALARPAQFCSLTLNRRDIIRVVDLNQIINQTSASRKLTLLITDDSQYIPGTNIWLRDRLSDLGLDITENFSEIFQYQSINLIYKTSGFTDKQYIQVIADQTSPASTNSGIVIPTENYKIALTKSAPIGLATYTSVVVQKSGTGFSVYGFDNDHPYFTIIPRRYEGTSYSIKISESYALIYPDDSNTIQTIPYGTQLATTQQVVDFLYSYGRYCESIGFTFTDTTSVDTVPLVADWQMSIKEFLYWLEQGWDTDVVIGLTPAGSKIAFNSGFGVADQLTNGFSGARVVDSSGRVMQSKDYGTYRAGTEFELRLKDENKGIQLIDIFVVQYEHTIIFDNTTVFNDIIYQPSLGNRQYRMKISGHKTGDWDGSLSAPGFMINIYDIEDWVPMQDYHKGDIVQYKNQHYTAQAFIPGEVRFDEKHWYLISTDAKMLNRQLIPNMAFNAEQFEHFYDVDQFDVNRDADNLARNSTGFRPRRYLTDMGLDNISQHKFYLGMIREKGTQAAVSAFMRSRLPYLQNDIQVEEQWALRSGSYGGLAQRSQVEISLANAKAYNGAHVIEFIDKDQTGDSRWNTFAPKDLLLKNVDYTPDMFAATEAHPLRVATAGKVLVGDVDLTVFNIQKIYNVNRYASVMGEGSRIWVAADKGNDWNVYRVTSGNNVQVIASVVVNDEIEFTTDKPHQLVQFDNVVLPKASIGSSNMAGFYRVNSVSGNTFRVPVYPKSTTASGPMAARLFYLRSVRFKDRSDFARSMPSRGWLEKDAAWIDGQSGNSQVLYNTQNWKFAQGLTPNFTEATDNFGSAVDIKATGTLMLSGSPDRSGKGCVYAYEANSDNTWGVINGIEPDDSYASEFGYCLQFNDADMAIVGSPGGNSGEGMAYVLDTSSTTLGVRQVIVPPETSQRFGHSVATSNDGNWVAVGAPEWGTVYLYRLTTVAEPVTQTRNTYGSDAFTVPTAASGANSALIGVRLDDRLLVPEVEYTVAADVITLATIPTELTITMEYRSGYEFQTLVRYSDTEIVLNLANAGIDTAPYAPEAAAKTESRFGSSIALDGDGSQLVIGAPGVIVNGLANVGACVVLAPNATNGTLVFTELKLPSVGTNSDLRFGTKVVLSSTGTNLYVGAIGYNNASVNNGAVFRYSNVGRTYGTIIGTAMNPTVAIGDTLTINDVLVTFTGTTIGKIITDINDAAIPGINASFDSYNRLRLTSDSTIAYNRIRLTKTANNEIFRKLGLSAFINHEVITSPVNQTTIDFGRQIAVSDDSNRMLVSATVATNKIVTTFDGGQTTLDNRSTTIYKYSYRSGSAFLFEYQADANETTVGHGYFTYAGMLSANSLLTNDLFGTGVAISNNWIAVTALNHRIDPMRAIGGTIYTFYNSTGALNWAVKRQQLDNVDSRRVDKMYLYDDYKKTVIAELPIIDPEHGMPVSAAPEQIRYIVNYDPATYNNVPNAFSFAFDGRHAWAEEHVGELWWDTNQIRYQDWNQGSVLTRFQNWGLTFPSSYASVYEWTESTLIPSQYATQNPKSLPLYTASDVYTAKTVIDPVTLVAQTKYYFWVSNSNVNTTNDSRETAVALQNLISNPRKITTPFAAIIGTRALALFNCAEIVNSDTVLHISTKNTTNENPVHTEWSLFDNTTSKVVSPEFLAKLNDSLAGEDLNGRSVPDTSLTEKMAYGISLRPRQTMFKDKFAARKTWVDNVNSELIRYPIALLRDISGLSDRDPAPKVGVTFYPTPLEGPAATVSIRFIVDSNTELDFLETLFYDQGDQAVVLNDTETGAWSVRELRGTIWQIVRVQSYNVTRCWNYTDWYEEGFSSTTPITRQVDFEYQIAGTVPEVGDVIRVKTGTDGNWRLVRVTATSLDLIGQGNATIQLNANIYDNVVAGRGLDGFSFEISDYASDMATEVRKIFTVLNDQIFTNDLAASYRKVVRAMIGEIVTQFAHTDWIFKTSLINVTQNVRGLTQIPVYVQQPEDIITDFINEVKPYHTKIQRYVGRYPGNDSADMLVTDFDLPAYYNSATMTYRGPQLGNALDSAAFENPIYQDWLQNHTYELDYVNIFDRGANYTTTTAAIVEGDGKGATVSVSVVAGEIANVIVTNPGSGYTKATIRFIGLGSGAKAFAVLGKGVARTLNTTMKFDRYAYQARIKDWAANTEYSPVDLITHDGMVYRITAPDLATSNTNSILVTGSEFVGFSEDRLTKMQVRPWIPNTQFAKNDLVVYNGKVYVALSDFVSDLNFAANTGYSVFSSVDWRANTDYGAGTVISFGSSAYVVNSGGYAGTIAFDDLLTTMIHPLSVYPAEYFDDAASRIWGYYQPESGMSGRQLSQVIGSLEYPGVSVIGAHFDQLMGFGFGLYESISYDSRTYDTEGILEVQGVEKTDVNFYSHFSDISLGTKPEDMIVDGSAYIDKFSSHAPEELLPGMIWDSLSVRVVTQGVLPSAPEIVAVNFAADGAMKTFSYDPEITGSKLPKEGVEGILVFNSLTGFQIESLDYTVNWLNQTITFAKAPITGDSITLRIIGKSGTNKVASITFTSDGSTMEFEVPDVKAELVKQIYVKVNNQTVNAELVTVSLTKSWTSNTAFIANEGVSFNNFVYRVTSNFISGSTFSTENLVAADKTVIRFMAVPPVGSEVSIDLYDSPTKSFSDIKRVSATITPDYIPSPLGYIISLPADVQTEPYAAQVMVTVNKNLLEPSNQAYYTANGSTTTFNLPEKRLISNSAAVNPTHVKVIVDGNLKYPLLDYTFSNDGINTPTVTFIEAPMSGSKVVVSNSYDANYVMDNAGTVTIKTNYSLNVGDRIDVIIFSDEAQYDMQTEVHTGGGISPPTSLDLGFDESSFDTQTWANEQTNLVVGSVYTLARPVLNTNYAIVSLNGFIMTPNIDFIMTNSTTIKFTENRTVTSADTIVVTSISEDHPVSSVEYRIFKGMSEIHQYIGTSRRTTTRLTRDLLIQDKWIYVEDVTALSVPDPLRAKPGVIFIDGERITFNLIDQANGRLGQIRRGTEATGGAGIHLKMTPVVDAGYKVEVPASTDIYREATTNTTISQELISQGKLWFTVGAEQASDGKGLLAAETQQAKFLRDL